MADTIPEFRENGLPTCKFVKYAGREYTVGVGGRHSLYAEIYDENKKVSAVEGTFNGERTLAVLPELERGIYWVKVICDGDVVSDERFVFVDDAYAPVKPPKGIIYYVFVDRFAKGGIVRRRSDAVMNNDWTNGVPQYAEYEGGYVENNMFFGGTLWGVADRINYIKSLGTEWLYLSPIFTAYSNHKYDTGDFLSVDGMFGGREALDNLVFVCHSKGIKVILDGVFNHVGRDSVYFDYLDVYGNGAYNHPDSPYREWFDIKDDGTYDCWWGITNLPKVRKIESYRRFICEKVIPEYMKAGIDGWRLDVVDEYDTAFLAEITRSSKKYNPDAIILGEVWDDVTDKVAYSERKKYFCGECLDSAMNYPVRNAVIGYIKSGDASELKNVVENQIKHYPSEKLLCMMNFLGTHDTERIITVLGDGFSNGLAGSVLASKKLEDEDYAKGKKLLKAAFALLSCLPGVPAIYYGDEAGLEGYRDPFNRRPFPWGNEDAELIRFFRVMAGIRAEHSALVRGSAEVTQCNDGFFVVRRCCGSDNIVCVCNMSEGYKYYVNQNLTPIYGSNVLSPGETGIYKEERYE